MVAETLTVWSLQCCFYAFLTTIAVSCFLLPQDGSMKEHNTDGSWRKKSLKICPRNPLFPGQFTQRQWTFLQITIWLTKWNLLFSVSFINLWTQFSLWLWYTILCRQICLYETPWIYHWFTGGKKALWWLIPSHCPQKSLDNQVLKHKWNGAQIYLRPGLGKISQHTPSKRHAHSQQDWGTYGKQNDKIDL